MQTPCMNFSIMRPQHGNAIITLHSSEKVFVTRKTACCIRRSTLHGAENAMTHASFFAYACAHVTAVTLQRQIHNRPTRCCRHQHHHHHHQQLGSVAVLAARRTFVHFCVLVPWTYLRLCGVFLDTYTFEMYKSIRISKMHQHQYHNTKTKHAHLFGGKCARTRALRTNCTKRYSFAYTNKFNRMWAETSSARSRRHSVATAGCLAKMCLACVSFGVCGHCSILLYIYLHISYVYDAYTAAATFAPPHTQTHTHSTRCASGPNLRERAIFLLARLSISAGRRRVGLCLVWCQNMFEIFLHLYIYTSPVEMRQSHIK